MNLNVNFRLSIFDEFYFETLTYYFKLAFGCQEFISKLKIDKVINKLDKNSFIFSLINAFKHNFYPKFFSYHCETHDFETYTRQIRKELNMKMEKLFANKTLVLI